MSRGGKEDHALGGGQVKELGGSLLQAAEETQAERRFTYVVTCPPEGDPPIPLHPVTQSLLNSFKAAQDASSRAMEGEVPPVSSPLSSPQGLL